MANDWIIEKNNETVIITLQRFTELNLVENRNQMLQRQNDELLIKILELQEMLNQKVITPTKKNKSKINAAFFKE